MTGGRLTHCSTIYRPNIIVSGGQTGADRGALDAALSLGLAIDGYVPKGRRAEDGVVPERYRALRESKSRDYPPRTYANVKMSDASLLCYYGSITRGTSVAVSACNKFNREKLLLDLERDDHELISGIRCWLWQHKPERLNVGGTRESKASGIHERVESLLTRAFTEDDPLEDEQSPEAWAATHAYSTLVHAEVTPPADHPLFHEAWTEVLTDLFAAAIDPAVDSAAIVSKRNARAWALEKAFSILKNETPTVHDAERSHHNCVTLAGAWLELLEHLG